MIYRCIPLPVERIWGALDPLEAGSLPIGEMWWFHDETMLEDIHGRQSEAGSFFRSGRVPVILKTLHTKADLSVQVHPGRDGSPRRKDESWAVLQGTGRILHGIRRGTTREAFRRAVEEGSVTDLLLSASASPGQVFHLPAGTVHALGAGLTVLEIQLNCTVTYRLWDYARKDPGGALRPLHVEDGLAAVDWQRMGRADTCCPPVVGTGDYTLERAPRGTVTLKPFQLAYEHGRGVCSFSDSQGGLIETGGETWIAGMRYE
jgi:mannose-6-phosphate isomerase class I